MDSYDEYSSSETDSEWEDRCDEAVELQGYDEESSALLEKMRALNVGYNPLKGYPDGFTQKKWLYPTVVMSDVVKAGKLQSGRVEKASISMSRVDDFLEAAEMFIHHHRRGFLVPSVPGYVRAVAAEMIRWQLL
jgi:hypothetical protein